MLRLHNFSSQDVSLYAIQLHLELRITDQYLATTFLEREKAFGEDDNDEVDISVEPQLDLDTD